MNSLATDNGYSPMEARSRSSDFEAALEQWLSAEDEARGGLIWKQAQRHVRELALRPAKRLRPKLLQLGYELVSGQTPPAELSRFAAGLELLHTFMLIHDDVADRSPLRRGGPALHTTLRAHGPGEDLAVVAGDHLFARALELMLSTQVAGAARATQYYLGICRHTAVGQYLDLSLASRPLSAVSPLEAIRVADLKTAKYSFGAPLACGAMLAGASEREASSLERMGRFAGLAFQFRDDLNGIFGETEAEGKPGEGDLLGAKKTFPLIVAWRRASRTERELLNRLGPALTREECARVKEIVLAREGVRLTERAIGRTLNASLRSLQARAPRGAVSRELAGLIRRLASAR